MKRTEIIVAMMVLGLSSACDVPGKSVGQEADDEGAGHDDGGVDGDDDPAPGTDGMDDGAEGPGDGGEGPGGGTEGPGMDDGACPPGMDEPSVPECATCALTADCQWSCDFSACPTDCGGLACLEACIRCDDPDDCAGGWSEGVCDPAQACVAEVAPEQCPGGLTEGFEEEFTVQYGCGDMVLMARNAADTVGLVININSLDVNSAGFEETYPMLDVSVAQVLEVRVGTNVTEEVCNDVEASPGPVIGELWTAESGSMDITIRGQGESGPVASVELNDVVFERRGRTVTMPFYSIDGIVVGWLPG